MSILCGHWGIHCLHCWQYNPDSESDEARLRSFSSLSDILRSLIIVRFFCNSSKDDIPETIEEILLFCSTHFNAASVLTGDPDLASEAPAVVFIATIPMPALLAFSIAAWSISLLIVL